MKNILAILFSVFVLFSCKKPDDVVIVIPSTEYKVADSMKLNSSLSTSDSLFYVRYNSNTYSNTELNMATIFNVDATGVTLQFKDNDAVKGNTLLIKFVGKTIDNVSGTYNLTSNSIVQYTQTQNFYNGAFAQNTPKAFVSGSITINYSLLNDFLYGSLNNVKHYIGVYVPYQSLSAGITQNTTQANTLMQNQSSRTYNVIFGFIKRG